jgi:PHD/YefM family antitoxin component YafN of YafNO toxin-antitoxin module
MNEETVTISKKEYESLKEDARWLQCLENAGVDNWEGYDFARELWREDNE